MDRETLDLRYRMIGSDVWSTTGARRRRTGVCRSGIIELVAELYLAGVLTPGRGDRRASAVRTAA